jgi:hypothetical protein
MRKKPSEAAIAFDLPASRRAVLVSVHPEIGKFGRDQGVRKILPQTYG